MVKTCSSQRECITSVRIASAGLAGFGSPKELGVTLLNLDVVLRAQDSS